MILPLILSKECIRGCYSSIGSSMG